MNYAHTNQMHHSIDRNRTFWRRHDRMARKNTDGLGALVNTHWGYFLEQLPGGEMKKHYSIHPCGRKHG